MRFSIIIPTLNEARDLPACVARIRECIRPGTDYEILVADCGSTDGTVDIARDLNCRVATETTERPCRAAGLNLGAGAARGDVFVFVDADTLLPPEFDRAIIQALENTQVVGGAFHMRFIERGFGVSVIAFVNYVRYHIWKEYYGDQVVFVRADTFRSIGGCPDVEILESAFLCRSLQKAGKLKLLKPTVKTSARRFIEGGVVRVFSKDFRIWILDLLGYDVNRYGREYWAYNARR
ncbi:MAG: glycosyltransferase [bacterium]|nr:glycosyltransferase [bacterium]